MKRGGRNGDRIREEEELFFVFSDREIKLEKNARII